ncbi:hypothetical protein HXA35_04245 [Bacillus sp. A301a_S52]|nr:hypothetical protein [Bacillus sp. A301a_S52]
MEKRFITIEDTTLREGEQTPGVAFNEKQKRTIVEKLAEANVKFIEVGIPIMGSLEYQTIKNLASDPNVPTLIGWNRGRKEDLDKTLEAGLKALHIGLPSSDIHIKEKFNKSYDWVIETAIELVEYAKKQGAEFISVSAEDMGRANSEFLKRYARALAKVGASRMRLSDTVGCLMPSQVENIVKMLKKEVPEGFDFQVHMHNDFNLALANVLAGVDAGASQVHVTINGLGDRAGLASFHQVIPALESLKGYQTDINMKKIPEISRLVSEYSKLPVAGNEPIVGEHVFTHESGIHVDGMLKVKESFEAFDPEMLGRKHEFVLGKHSGSAAIQYILAQEGLDISRDIAKDIIPAIREVSTILGTHVSPSLAVSLAKNVMKSKSLVV